MQRAHGAARMSGVAAFTMAWLMGSVAHAGQPVEPLDDAASNRSRYTLVLLAQDVSGSATQASVEPQSALPDTSMMGEIVVTARKRAESNLDVPVAISTVLPAVLARANVSDISQITNLVPQILLARGSSGSGGTMGIRGISTNYTDRGVDSPVTIALDGAEFSRNFITQTAALDLANVQVLKGPQALFFGKNSLAGVIAFTSNDPGDEYEGMVRGGYEFRADQAYVEGFVSGPLNDSFGVRLAARYDTMKGYFRNNARATPNPFADKILAPTFPGGFRRSPDANTLSARLTLAFTPPTDDFTANLKVLYNRYRDTESTGYNQVVSCTGGGPDDGGFIDPFGDCKPDRNRSAGLLPEVYTRGFPNGTNNGTINDTYLVTLKMDKDFGDATISTQSSYFNTDIAVSGCVSYTVYCRSGGPTGEKTENFQQEIRLLTELDSPLNFSIGGFFESFTRDNYVYLLAISATARVIQDANGLTYVSELRQSTKGNTLSAFGQAIFKLTPEIEFTAGARFTHETKDGNFVNVYRNEANASAVAQIAPINTPIRPTFRGDNLSPEFTARWRITPRQTVFAAYRTGFKSGGFSTASSLLKSTLAQGVSALEFGAEKGRGGEIGYKAELFDRRLILNTDLYYYKFTGLQRAAINLETSQFTVRNAAAAISKGFEIDANYLAAPGLNFKLSAGYNRARYKRFDTAPCYTPSAPACKILPNGLQVLDLSGRPLSRAPAWVVAGGANYDFPVTSNIAIGLSADARYSSKYVTQEDGNPNGFQAGYTKYNAGISVHDVDDRWEVALNGRNLTDKYVVLYSAGKPGSLAVPGIGPDLLGNVDRGREIVMQGTVRF